MTITLATLASATPQDVFDQVVAHAREQRRKSLVGGSGSDGSSCAYRGAGDHLKCFGGALISDKEMEELSIANNVAWKTTANHLNIHAHEELISNLQNIHDCFTVSQWDSRFSHTAGVHQLDYEPQHIDEAVIPYADGYIPYAGDDNE